MATNKVGLSASDITPDFLESKLIAGDNVILSSTIDQGTNVLSLEVVDQITHSLQTVQEKVKISASDITSNYLYDKVVAGQGVLISIRTINNEQKLVIEAMNQVVDQNDILYINAQIVDLSDDVVAMEAEVAEIALAISEFVNICSGTITRGVEGITSVSFEDGRSIAITRVGGLISSTFDGIKTITMLRDNDGNLTGWTVT